MRALALLLCVAACGDNHCRHRPVQEPAARHEITDKDLTAPVHVARDKFGVAHIDGADRSRDVAFAQGYVMAHDRLPQMDILRRFGAGTLAELFGALDPSVIDTDLEMRVHRMKPLAAGDLGRCSRPRAIRPTRRSSSCSSASPTASTRTRPTSRPSKCDLDPNLLVSFDPARFVAWSPVDSLVLGRFQAFALSWSTPFEVDLDRPLPEAARDLRQRADDQRRRLRAPRHLAAT